ncbi:hypothetical protein MRS44_017137 [Fusarium solani]|uniref:uncharacterized protein n=1 Tax=Fusarium solani TaxID=169388 RepID=UPI0032C403E5|nr:hypothetical protein MRS44_017137 [Fusarium solani]
MSKRVGCCYGHILNLVARAFLFGNHADAFELESDINSIRGLAEQDLAHWRTKCPIGKLHNIVKFIRLSPQRSEQFKRIAQEQDHEGYRLCEESTAGLEMTLNNETRWNSTYLMIQRALRKQTDIRAFLFAVEGESDAAKRIPSDDILSNEDWPVLGEISEILKPIHLQTIRTQGWGKGDGHGRLWEVLVGMEYLLEHLEEWKSFYDEVTVETPSATKATALDGVGPTGKGSEGRPARVRHLPARFEEDEVYLPQEHGHMPSGVGAASSECSQAAGKAPASGVSQKSGLPSNHQAFIRTSINNGWKKLDEYYAKLGESPLFAAAVVLHPRFGISWLEAAWVSKEQLTWVQDAKMGIKEYFNRWYDSRQGGNEEKPHHAILPRTMGQEDGHYSEWINSKTKKAFATGNSFSELDRYLRIELQDTQDQIQWWRDHRASFPLVSRFVLDVLAIPAMASDCERQFSLAKLALTSQRLSMGSGVLEQVQCLKNWVRHGGVELGSWVTG